MLNPQFVSENWVIAVALIILVIFVIRPALTRLSNRLTRAYVPIVCASALVLQALGTWTWGWERESLLWVYCLATIFASSFPMTPSRWFRTINRLSRPDEVAWGELAVYLATSSALAAGTLPLDTRSLDASAHHIPVVLLVMPTALIPLQNLVLTELTERQRRALAALIVALPLSIVGFGTARDRLQSTFSIGTAAWLFGMAAWHFLVRSDVTAKETHAIHARET